MVPPSTLYARHAAERQDLFATPMVKKEPDHYVAPIAFHKPIPIETNLSKECNKNFDKDGELIPVPKQCEIQLPVDGKLVLDDGLRKTHGILGSEIQSGTHGSVYHIEGHWSSNLKRVAVAKWLKYTNEGVKELQNMISLGWDEYFAYGVDSRLPPGLWIILPYKTGKHLEDLDSFLESVFEVADINVCKDYMKNKRKAIVVESMKYIKMAGGPRHGDLHQDNVLFEGTSGEEEARLIDWGDVYWTYPDGKKPDDSEADKIKKALEASLERGFDWPKKSGEDDKPDYYDFSDENNCF